MVNLYNIFYVIKLIFAAGDSERFFDYIMIPRNSERIFYGVAQNATTAGLHIGRNRLQSQNSFS